VKYCNADIRERVIQTTRELLLRHGLKGWNVDLLARETGLAKNTLYRIIGSKEQLLEQVVFSKMSQDIRHIEKISREEKDYLTAVNKMIEKFVELAKNDILVTQIFVEYPSMEKRIRSSRKEIIASICTFIKHGMDIGLVRDDLSPEFIFELAEGMALHYFRIGMTGSEFERSFQCAMDCLINGLRKRDQ